MRRLRLFLEKLASPWPLFWLLPYLMLLLVASTVAQKYVGLYVAVNTFFNAPFIWLGGYLPLPGGALVLGFIFISLLFKFLLKSEWAWPRAGLNLAHLGALVLLGGGMLSAVDVKEGSLPLLTGETAASYADYHVRELVLLKDGAPVATLDPYRLEPGDRLFHDILPMAAVVETACRNCHITKRTDAPADAAGMAQAITLAPKPPEKEDEANTGGLTFRAGRLHALIEEGPPAELADGYALHYGKQAHPLPFSIKLLKFTKDVYPGTDTARSFASDIEVTEGSLQWTTRIEMNAPLRLRGHTLYQSSFFSGPGGDGSVLAVVENRARLFPYVATGLLGFGLLLHALLRRRDAP